MLGLAADRCWVLRTQTTCPVQGFSRISISPQRGPLDGLDVILRTERFFVFFPLTHSCIDSLSFSLSLSAGAMGLEVERREDEVTLDVRFVIDLSTFEAFVAS